MYKPHINTQVVDKHLTVNRTGISQSQLWNLTVEANHTSDTMQLWIWQQEPAISWSISNCTLACVGGSVLNYSICCGVSSARLLHCVIGQNNKGMLQHQHKQMRQTLTEIVSGEWLTTLSWLFQADAFSEGIWIFSSSCDFASSITGGVSSVCIVFHF